MLCGKYVLRDVRRGFGAGYRSYSACAGKGWYFDKPLFRMQGELSGDWLGQQSDNVNLKLDFTPSHEPAFIDSGAALKVSLHRHRDVATLSCQSHTVYCSAY